MHFRDFFEIFGIPSKVRFWGVSSFFKTICQNFRSISAVFQWNILEGFPNFFIGFPIFLVRFLIFFYMFPLFKKTLIISIFLSVSSKFRFVSLNFLFVSAFYKNFKNINLLIGFLKFLIHFLIFLIRLKTLKISIGWSVCVNKCQLCHKKLPLRRVHISQMWILFCNLNKL